MAHKAIKEESSTFKFPILESYDETNMNKIQHSALPNFHALSKEDPDTLLFEFDVLCGSYD